jgi:hypothetical protein
MPLSGPALDAAGWRGGKVMAMKSKRIETELFEDVPVLRRKWQAALPPGEKLPRYEDVMLGSLGRLADHIVLLKHNRDALGRARAAMPSDG